MKHLKELLRFATSEVLQKAGISKVLVFSTTLPKDHTYAVQVDIIAIKRRTNPVANFLFQRRTVKKTMLEYNCDLIFAPGGTFYDAYIPYVSMSQNMLVFEKKERNRFPFGFTWLRYRMLQFLQSKSLKYATGNIFISDYAHQYISELLPSIKTTASQVIPLGASSEFNRKPKTQQPINYYNNNKPFRLTYISIVNYYKHQWQVVEATKILRKKGFPIELNLYGPMKKGLESKLDVVIKGHEEFIKYHGSIPYNQIQEAYHTTDTFVFASTCENMPNILVEAMSSGLPIASSDYGPMPEVLRDGGVYFDPMNISSISMALESLLINPEKRMKLAQKAYDLSTEFTWERCAKETFDFLGQRGKF